MINNLKMVQHEEFGKLEILTIDGKPYFPATESAKILGYSDPYDAIKRHTKGSVKHRVLTLGGEQERKFIPEGDLYRLIARSKLPAAEQFERWVFDEVLPSIRKHGVYVTDDMLDNLVRDPDLAYNLFRKLQDERSKTAALEEHVERLTPKARYCDIILQCKNALPVSLIAKDYGMSAVAFNRLLHNLGIQHKIGGAWILYQRFAGKGYTKSHTYYTPGGTAVYHTCWTQKGRMFLFDVLAHYDILPTIEALAGLH